MAMTHPFDVLLRPAALALALATVAVTPPASATSPVRRDPGQALFVGAVPLIGRIREHAGALPAVVVKCDNCHGAQVSGSTDATAPPRLSRAFLTEPRVRRGGPPSAYDVRAFCKLLRTGIDPASILIARQMPTYDVADGQCRALWRFVTKVSSDAAEANTPK
jgi:hypothetical protein